MGLFFISKSRPVGEVGLLSSECLNSSLGDGPLARLLSRPHLFCLCKTRQGWG